ncbi:hypothetical protein VTK26DRAFT_2253 [Humicola hyalothermophila]
MESPRSARCGDMTAPRGRFRRSSNQSWDVKACGWKRNRRSSERTPESPTSSRRQGVSETAPRSQVQLLGNDVTSQLRPQLGCIDGASRSPLTPNTISVCQSKHDKCLQDGLQYYYHMQNNKGTQIGWL